MRDLLKRDAGLRVDVELPGVPKEFPKMTWETVLARMIARKRKPDWEKMPVFVDLGCGRWGVDSF